MIRVITKDDHCYPQGKLIHNGDESAMGFFLTEKII